MASEALMNIKELSKYLRVETTTLYHWSKQGRIPAYKLGTMWRFRKSDIDEWLEGQKTQPGGSA